MPLIFTNLLDIRVLIYSKQSPLFVTFSENKLSRRNGDHISALKYQNCISVSFENGIMGNILIFFINENEENGLD